MGGDSNPRCLSAHTLSRRAQSTALSPILLAPHSNRRFFTREAVNCRVQIAVVFVCSGSRDGCNIREADDTAAPTASKL
jgi:hypothetical protein